MTGQSNDAADRSASLIRDAQPTTRASYVWPVLTVDDHLKQALRFHDLRLASHARRGGDFVELSESVLALEVVRLRALLTEQGSFY
jgi:hypothetical protein